MRILIERDGGVGDIIMLLPAIKKLAEKHTLSLKTKYPELLLGIPYVTPVEGDYDKTINLNGGVEPREMMRNGQTSLIDYKTISRIDLWFNLLDIKPPPNISLDYHVMPSEREWASNMVKGINKPIITYVSNATSAYRTYPIELARNIIKELAKKYYVIIIGTGWDHKWSFDLSSNDPSIFNLMNMINIRELGALLSVSSLVISSDTGPMHLAAAQNIPTLALFGGITPSLRCNYYPTVSTIWYKLPCHCEDLDIHSCPSHNAIERDAKIGASCMWRISPTEIIKKVETILTGDIKLDIINYCEGVGTTLGESYLLNPDELNYKGQKNLDYIYSCKGLNVSARFVNSLNRIHSQLKVGGRFILHEPLGIYNDIKYANKLLNKNYCENLLQSRYDIIWSESVCGKDFALIGQKKEPIKLI